ncbi:hypothetical protein Dda_2958 [Drechslerella dactyloides]|uniref:Uncharacterized protein n=1 Tax=Drechslerella dactyloides TaxID=74499 RepID=A0AAD6J0F9_DREDA|nr:hypothetical protein Dda_2958 [Drechslerella dactyloides]
MHPDQGEREMRPTKILRVARSDERGSDQPVVLHVQPTAATIPLNLAIAATDGADSFGLTLKDSKAKTLKDPASELSDDDWKAVLRAVLLADPPPEDLRWLPTVQLSALVNNDGIAITVREDVGGIRRRLGALTLAPQELEIELWDWLDRVCRDREAAETRCRRAEKDALEARAKLEALERQVQDLSQAKKKHEDALILQFQHLLNQKKKRIRELSRGAAATPLSPDLPAAAVSGRKRKQGDAGDDGDEDDREEEDPAGDSDVEMEAAGDRLELVDPDAEDRHTTDGEATTDDDDDEL